MASVQRRMLDGEGRRNRQAWETLDLGKTMRRGVGDPGGWREPEREAGEAGQSADEQFGEVRGRKQIGRSVARRLSGDHAVARERRRSAGLPGLGVFTAKVDLGGIDEGPVFGQDPGALENMF